MTIHRFKESLRLTLIVGSSLSIALAGNLAQSRDQEPAAQAPSFKEQVKLNEAVVKKVTARAIQEAPRAETKLEKFATRQVRTFQELLDGLTERAEMIAEMKSLSQADRTRLQEALKNFDQDLMIARESLERMKASKTNDDPFLEEELKSSLFTVQESASAAQGEVIGLDDFQGFKVSRTGQ